MPRTATTETFTVSGAPRNLRRFRSERRGRVNQKPKTLKGSRQLPLPDPRGPLWSSRSRDKPAAWACGRSWVYFLIRGTLLPKRVHRKSQLQLHQFHRGRVRKTLKLGRGITPSAVRFDSRISLIGAPNARMGIYGSLARAGFPPSCEGGGGRRSTRAGGTEGAPNGWSGESQPKPERLGLPLGASSSSNKQNARKQNGKILQKLAVYQTYR